MTCRILVLVSVLVWSCSDPPEPTGQMVAAEVLSQFNIISDTSDNDLLSKVFTGLNCLSAGCGGKKLVFEKDFVYSDTNQVLLIPYATSLKELSSSAYSNVVNRFIIINPSFIRRFATESLLSDTNGLEGLFELTLLHELGHFRLGIDGRFDAPKTESTQSRTGEQKMDTEPEYLTTIKRKEMAVDSMAIVMVKNGLSAKDINCTGTALDVQLILPGMSFQLFGTRLLDQFGQTHKILRDPSPSHPNMELRVAFMNYFLMPNDQLKEMIDTYLYDREVAPIHRQETDPRIFQGREKILPEDQ